MLTIPTLILTSDTNRVELVRVRARRGRRPSNFKQQQPVNVLHSGPVGGSHDIVLNSAYYIAKIR